VTIHLECSKIKLCGVKADTLCRVVLAGVGPGLATNRARLLQDS
jgi:hypothetical protein